MSYYIISELDLIKSNNLIRGVAFAANHHYTPFPGWFAGHFMVARPLTEKAKSRFLLRVFFTKAAPVINGGLKYEVLSSNSR